MIRAPQDQTLLEDQNPAVPKPPVVPPPPNINPAVPAGQIGDVPPPAGLPVPTEITPADPSSSPVNAPIAPPARADQAEVATETVNMAPDAPPTIEPPSPFPPPPDIRPRPSWETISDVPPVVPSVGEIATETGYQGNDDQVIGVPGSLPPFDPTAGSPITLAIDPSNDLRSTVIPGTPSTRTTTARAATDAAAAAMTTDANKLAATQTGAAETALGVDPTKVGDANSAADAALSKLTGTDRQKVLDDLMKKYMTEVGPDARLSKLQGQVDTAADDLAGVDRYKLALDKFNTFAEDSDPAFQKTLRDIMERETAAGGFSGRINTSFGDAGLARERDLRSERSRLLQQALSDSVQDALSKEGALSELEGQLSGQRLNRFNTAANVSTTNANANMGALSDAVSATRGRAGDLTAAELAAQNQGTTRAGQQLDTERSNVATKAALENQSSSQDQMDANNLRGERDYEVGQESEAYQRSLAQYREEQAAQEAAFEREMAILGAGMTGNPAGEIGSLATMVNPSLDLATLAQMAQGAGYAGGYKPPGAVAPGGGTDWGAFIESLLKGNTPIPKPTSTNVPPSTLPG